MPEFMNFATLGAIVAGLWYVAEHRPRQFEVARKKVFWLFSLTTQMLLGWAASTLYIVYRQNAGADGFTVYRWLTRAGDYMVPWWIAILPLAAVIVFDFLAWLKAE